MFVEVYICLVLSLSIYIIYIYICIYVCICIQANVVIHEGAVVEIANIGMYLHTHSDMQIVPICMLAARLQHTHCNG